MSYWDLRREVARIVPRRTQLIPPSGDRRRQALVKEKGRKSNYRQMDLRTGEFKKMERLLNVTEVKSFLEISLRAAACPMPLNLDVWDGLHCPYACQYCFADAFRASLYTSFFDNSKEIGLRHCSPDYYKEELDRLLKVRGRDPHSVTGSEVKKAIAMEIPMRFGIRFEDFTPAEKKYGISLQLLRYLGEVAYPYMINTKSDLLAEDDYLKALTSNKAKTAVHVTTISSNDTFLKSIEPGAPSFQKRVDACAALVRAGVRVVARIEPFMVFLTDDREDVERWMDAFWKAGVRHITFDTYSYSANNPGIRQAFINRGYDFERMFALGCDSQGLGSLLLESFMKEFRQRGFSCSTFDLGCQATNDQTICCEVGDWFKDSGFNWGSIVVAARLIIKRGTTPTRWSDFVEYVNQRGGFLSPMMELELKWLWNLTGNIAYLVNWAAGVEPVGEDEDGIVWNYRKDIDFRKELLG